MKFILRHWKVFVPVLLVVVLAVGWLLYCTFCGYRGSEDWGGERYEHLVYADVSESDYLNLYLPADAGEDTPLLILVHGGGFISNDCTSTQARYMYEYFREHGYACASINYRLSGEATYPAAICDVKAAIRYLRANAETYGLDADRFVIWGESAGAYLATMAALSNDSEFCDVAFVGEEENSGVSASVYALAEYYGPMEFFNMDGDYETLGLPLLIRRLIGTSSNGTTDAADSMESLWVGQAIGTLTEEQEAELSPLTYLEENREELAGMHIYIRHGSFDITIPNLQSQRLADTAADLLGEEQVNYQLMSTYQHADNRFYTEQNMQALESWLNALW